MTLATITLWLQWAGAAPATLAPILYARVPWWRSPLGRHLMIYMITIAIVLDLTLVRILIGSAPTWYTLTRTIAFGAVVATLWWRLIIVLKAQLTGRREPIIIAASLTADELLESVDGDRTRSSERHY